MNWIEFDGSSEKIPVGKILCLGRNYSEHAREMHAETPEAPVVFLKPSTALLHEGGKIVIPSFSHDVHHEVELVVAIGKTGSHIAVDRAMEYVSGYAVGLDMTLRDVQSEAKKKSLPWSVAKGFDTSAPISRFVSANKIRDPHNLDMTLRVNGSVRQHSNTSKMIFKIDFTISYLSSIFTLEEGDLIFTGTPEGVGGVVAGDLLEAELESVGWLRVSMQ
ncbi:MAG: fumarylacetoacetate hydrolase family protein [Ignavibacteriae bacterium]|nr:fumarylacetoacetate hydrolase family protein [Ignavibacteriota bacterium]